MVICINPHLPENNALLFPYSEASGGYDLGIDGVRLAEGGGGVSRGVGGAGGEVGADGRGPGSMGNKEFQVPRHLLWQIKELIVNHSRQERVNYNRQDRVKR